MPTAAPIIPNSAQSRISQVNVMHFPVEWSRPDKRDVRYYYNYIYFFFLLALPAAVTSRSMKAYLLCVPEAIGFNEGFICLIKPLYSNPLAMTPPRIICSSLLVASGSSHQGCPLTLQLLLWPLRRKLT